MHQQIKASPDDTAANMRRVIGVLRSAHINIESIAPDFDPPHVRVLVRHNEPYDPNDATDPFNRALQALRDDGLDPTVVPSVELVAMPNVPGALQAAIDSLDGEGRTLDSILVLPSDNSGEALVSFGVRGDVDGWEDEADRIRGVVQTAVDSVR